MMFHLHIKLQFYLYPAPVDMRKSFYTLSGILASSNGRTFSDNTTKPYFAHKNIFEEGELQENATVKDHLTVQTEGKREVQRYLKIYNLDVSIIIPVSDNQAYRHFRNSVVSPLMHAVA